MLWELAYRTQRMPRRCTYRGRMDPIEDTLPRTYTCPLCPWEFSTYFGILMVRAVAEHDRIEHDIPEGSACEPPC